MLRDALEGLVLLQLNTAEPEGKELAETFKVQGVPTFALLDAEGRTLDSWVGYGRPEGWTERLAEALKEPITVAGRQARYRSTPTSRTPCSWAKSPIEKEVTGKHTVTIDRPR